MKKTLMALCMGLAVVAAASTVVKADQKVKLTGYLVDVMCASGHMKNHPQDADSFAAGHTKSCGLEDGCAASGYGIVSGGKWYPFDAKGNEMAKALFEKTKKENHISATVEGVQTGDKILVEKLTESE
jgi:hypothetical protein